jgi:hypothetical protein
LTCTVIRRIDEVAKGFDTSGTLQRDAFRSSDLEAGELRVEIGNGVGSPAIKIDRHEMPRFQRCLAQAYDLMCIAWLTIDEQCRRRIESSYGVAATVPFVDGRFALSPAFPSDKTDNAVSTAKPGRAHACRTGRTITRSSSLAGTAERQPCDRGNPVFRAIASDGAVPVCLLTGQLW